MTTEELPGSRKFSYCNNDFVSITFYVGGQGPDESDDIWPSYDLDRIKHKGFIPNETARPFGPITITSFMISGGPMAFIGNMLEYTTTGNNKQNIIGQCQGPTYKNISDEKMKDMSEPDLDEKTE